MDQYGNNNYNNNQNPYNQQVNTHQAYGQQPVYNQAQYQNQQQMYNQQANTNQAYGQQSMYNQYQQQPQYNQNMQYNQYQNNIPQQKAPFKLKPIDIVFIVFIGLAAMLMGFKLLMGDLSFGDVTPFMSATLIYVVMRFIIHNNKNKRV